MGKKPLYGKCGMCGERKPVKLRRYKVTRAGYVVEGYVAYQHIYTGCRDGHRTWAYPSITTLPLGLGSGERPASQGIRSSDDTEDSSAYAHAQSN